jgi:hypothetical protein
MLSFISSARNHVSEGALSEGYLYDVPPDLGTGRAFASA